MKTAASKRALKRVALANRRREGVQIPPVTAERRLASMNDSRNSGLKKPENGIDATGFSPVASIPFGFYGAEGGI